jgi:hypothetical protein
MSHDIFNNLHYIIFDTSETGSIDFTEVKETSIHTLRLNLSGSQTFVKYEGDTMPTSVSSLTTKEGPYSHTEILNILTGSEWVDPNGPI